MPDCVDQAAPTEVNRLGRDGTAKRGFDAKPVASAWVVQP